MQRRVMHGVLGSLFLIGGVWACAVAQLIIHMESLGGDPGLGIIAGMLAITMCAAGVTWLFRPVTGMLLAVATLIPQAFSFAGGSIAYALHLWPNYRIELNVLGTSAELLDVFIHPFSWSPSWTLRSDAGYIGFGVGTDLVCLAILVALAIAILVERRASKAPNQPFKPTPSARLNSRR